MTRHNISTVWHSKNRMRPIAMIVLVAMLCTLLPVAALAGSPESAAQTGKTINLLESGVASTTPSGIFSELTLSVENSVVDSKGELKLNFAFALDDTTRQVIYEEATSGSSLIMTLGEYVDKNHTGDGYDAYLNSCGDELPQIGFVFQLDSAMGIALEKEMTADITLTDGTAIGTFTVTPMDGGNLQFDCKLNKSLYSPQHKDISGGGNFTVKFSRGDLGGQQPVLQWQEQPGIVTILFPDAYPDDVSGTEFTVVKETIGAQCQGDKKFPQKSPYLDYQVTLTAAPRDGTATQVYLNGLLFEDAIPDGLQVTTVQVVYTYGDSESTSTELQQGSDYKIDGQNHLICTLPVSTAQITEAVFTVHTRLNEAEYTDYLYKSGYEKAFTNHAYLCLPDKNKKVLGEATTSDTIKPTFLTKEGKKVGLDSRRFQWTIGVNTYFYSSADVYLVDCIDNPAVHSFDTNEKVVVTRGEEKTEFTVGTLDESKKISSYKEITIEKLNALGISEKTVVCYNVTDADGKVTEQLLIMKLPQEWCKGAFTVQYETDVLAELGNNGSKLDNKAKLVWQYIGTGTEPVQPPTWEVEKNLWANHAIVHKTGGGYDPKTQTVTWNFEVNQYGTTLSEVTITDTIDTSKYELVAPAKNADDTTYPDLKVTVHDRTSGNQTAETMTVPYNTSDVSNTGNYYTVTTGTNNSQTLTIHFGKIAAEQVYRFSIQSKVINAEDILAGAQTATVDNVVRTIIGGFDTTNAVTERDTQKGTDPKAANEIVVTAIPQNGTAITQKSTAQQSLKHTWLQKAVQAQYNVETHKILWQVTANPDNLPIQDMQIIDCLPVGTVYSGIASATCKSASDTTAEMGVVGANGEIVFSQHNVKLVPTMVRAKDIVNDNETVTFTVQPINKDNANVTDCSFVLQIETEYPQDYRTAQFKNGAEITAVNQSMMRGKLYGSDIEARVQSTAKFTPNLLTKRGTYHAFTENKPAYIDWSVDVNVEEILLGKKGNAGEYEAAVLKDVLRPGMDLDISTLKICCGNDNVTEQFTDKTVTNRGFTISIPEEYRSKTLALSFRTYLVSDLEAADMTNDITLKWAERTASAGTSAKDAQSFSLTAYAKMSKSPMLLVEKISTRQAEGEKVWLNGAEFALTAVNQNGQAVNPEQTIRKQTANGKALFYGLTKNTIYKLEETKAPEGYLPTEDSVQYVVFADSDSFNDLKIGEKAVTVYNVSDKGYFQTVTVTNTPTRGCIVGHKQDIVGAGGLAGATIGLFNDETKEPALQTTESGEFGQFNFNNLTPGTYYIKELQAPKGYYLNETPVKVILTDANCAPNSAPVTVDVNKNPIVIEDEAIPVKGCIIGQKTDTAGKSLAGAVITLTGDASQNDGNETVNKTCTTDDNGLFSFSGLKPGTYTLQETKAPAGYKISEQSFTVELSKENCKSGDAVRNDTESKPLTIVNTKIPSSGGGETPITPPEKPTGPTEPTKPTEPEQPTEPIKPTEPTVPEQPEQPVPPTEPVTPQHPEWGDLPTKLPYPVTADSPDEITILEDGVPTTYVKMWDPETEEFIYIPEDEVPLTSAEPEEPIGDAPATGDNAPVTAMLLLLAASAAGLRVVTRKEEK